MREQDHLWMLISKELTGEASQEELQELTRLMQEDPGAQYHLQVVSAWWQTAQQKETGETVKRFNKLLLRIKEEEQGGQETQGPANGMIQHQQAYPQLCQNNFNTGKYYRFPDLIRAAAVLSFLLLCLFLLKIVME
jgi:hypothetical protein